MKILQIYGPSTSASAQLLSLYFEVWTTGPPRSNIQAVRSLSQQAHEFNYVMAQRQTFDKSLFPKAKIVFFKECQFSDPQLLYLSGILANSGQGKQPLIPGRILTSSIPTAAIGLLMLMLSSHQEVKVDPLGVPLLINMFNLVSYQIGLLGGQRSKNLLDGGSPFYKVHQTKDGVVAVGNLQPKFFKTMVDMLAFTSQDKKFLIKHQSDPSSWKKIDEIIGRRLIEVTTARIVQLAKGQETCLSQIKKTVKDIRRDIIKPIERTKL